MLLGAFVYKSLCGYMFSSPLGKYPRVKLLVLTVNLCLTFKEISKLFPKCLNHSTFYHYWIKIPVFFFFLHPHQLMFLSIIF